MIEQFWYAVGTLMCFGACIAAHYYGWGRVILALLALVMSFETITPGV